jgi:DNA-binding NarL/FixJ family response regulator
MAILIVEDDQNKLQQLRSFLSDTHPHLEVVEKQSYQAGLHEVLEGTFQLAILDMSMPTYDIKPGESGGRPRIFGGRELLQQMHRRGIHTPVIIFTQFETFREAGTTVTVDELSHRLKADHPDIYVGTVYYSAALDSWKSSLKLLMKEYWLDGDNP